MTPQQKTPETTKQLEDAGTAHVPAPSADARRIVGGVLQQSMRADAPRISYEGVVLTTPSVLEALDLAVEEIEALKRSL